MLKSAAVFAAVAGAIVGLGLTVWTHYASAPFWLLQADDFLTRSATREPTTSLQDSLISLAERELKVKELPTGYRYLPLPYPIPADWDDPDNGACRVHNLARTVPHPKSSTYIPTDSTVDGMYGLFLANVKPPSSESRPVQEVFRSYLGARKTFDSMEKDIRKELGPEAAQQWRVMRKQAAQRMFELSEQLQHALNATSGTYAQALADYANDAYRVQVNCTSYSVRQPGFVIRESLKEFRETVAERVSISALAELLELPVDAQGQEGAKTEMGPVRTNISFRKARIFNIEPRPWFSKEALLTLSSQLSPDSPRMWGNDGLFPLMPVAVLAVTEPVLKVALTKEQAKEFRDLISRGSTLQVGQFNFDFSKPGTYSVANADGSLKTDLEFVSPRNEVVVLGIIAKRPDLR